MSKLELLKKLEYWIAFQQICLDREEWSDFDLAQNEVSKLEKEIIEWPK